MDTADTRKLYIEDEILPKLESAMVESTGPVKADIRGAIEERKKELRNEQSPSPHPSSKPTGTDSSRTSD